MRKKQGFTLIELLAVIVILAVIALIATPIVIGIIEDSRQSAFKSSLYGVFDAADYKLVQDKNTQFPSEGIDVSILPMSNNTFTSGTVFQDDSGMYLENVTDGKYCGNGYKDKLEVTKGQCIKDTEAKWFTFDKNTGTITNYDINGPKDVVIPKNIDGVAVTTIGNNAFKEKQLTSAVLPNSITNIGTYAFSTNQLKKIVIPDSVVTIGYSAFERNQLVKVSISKNIKRIENSTFYLNKLTSISIPDGVTFIGAQAFYNNQLTNVNIPSSVTSIEKSAFINNQLPDSRAFIYNRNSDGTEDKTSLNSYGGANRSNVVIPDNIITIGEQAFFDSNITAITIPSSVTSTGSLSFAINKLTSIIIPGTLKNIGRNSFQDNLLTSVTISDGVNTINADAFSYNQLTSVTIPNSVTIVDVAAFNRNQLTTVKIIGKSSSSEFTTYGPAAWGWAAGYNDSNITWNAVE